MPVGGSVRPWSCWSPTMMSVRRLSNEYRQSSGARTDPRAGGSAGPRGCRTGCRDRRRPAARVRPVVVGDGDGAPVVSEQRVTTRADGQAQTAERTVVESDLERATCCSPPPARTRDRCGLRCRSVKVWARQQRCRPRPFEREFDGLIEILFQACTAHLVPRAGAGAVVPHDLSARCFKILIKSSRPPVFRR